MQSTIENVKNLTIEELKQVNRNSKELSEHIEGIQNEEPVIVLKNLKQPDSPPCFEEGIEIYDFDSNPRPTDDVKSAYGTRPNVPVADVVKAIRSSIGNNGYTLHISDSSYTGYSIWQLNEFMVNFDNTNLRTWIAQTFDCDDFSEVLSGNVNGFFPGIAFGTIWYGPKNPPYNWGHSVNIFYNYVDKKIYLVEPQSDKFYLFDQKKWSAWMIII
jgi:hypothetical protein